MKFGKRSRAWVQSVMAKVRQGRAHKRRRSITWSGCAVRYRACRLGADREASARVRERNKVSAGSSRDKVGRQVKRVREERAARRRVEGNRVGASGGAGFVVVVSRGYAVVIPKAG